MHTARKQKMRLNLKLGGQDSCLPACKYLVPPTASGNIDGNIDLTADVAMVYRLPPSMPDYNRRLPIGVCIFRLPWSCCIAEHGYRQGEQGGFLQY